MRGISRVFRAGRARRGACARCLRWRPLHETTFNRGTERIAVFCERCFTETEPGDRLRYYRREWAAQREERDPETGETLPAIQDEGTRLARYRTNTLMWEWNEIHRAVMAGA